MRSFGAATVRERGRFLDLTPLPYGRGSDVSTHFGVATWLSVSSPAARASSAPIWSTRCWSAATASRVLDDFSTGSWDNLEDVRDRVEVIEGDITDPATVRSAMRDVEVVFHQAALASVPRSVANPLATHRVCVDGTLQVLLAARDAKVRRVVYAASSSAYGNSVRLPKSESDPTAPLSPYAVAKLAGEHYCAAFSEVYGLETVRLRYFNVFGPRQTPDSPYAAVIPLFIRALTTGRSPVIHGDGEQSRDFTFVADVVQANLLAASAPGVSGRVYNVACGRRTTPAGTGRPAERPARHVDRADAHGPARRRREAQPGGHRAGEGGPRLPAHNRHERGASSLPGVAARPERM